MEIKVNEYFYKKTKKANPNIADKDFNEYVNRFAGSEIADHLFTSSVSMQDAVKLWAYNKTLSAGCRTILLTDIMLQLASYETPIRMCSGIIYNYDEPTGVADANKIANTLSIKPSSANGIIEELKLSDICLRQAMAILSPYLENDTNFIERALSIIDVCGDIKSCFIDEGHFSSHVYSSMRNAYTNIVLQILMRIDEYL